MTWNLTYELCITHLISCVNFIENGQVGFEYGCFKGSNPLNSMKECIWAMLK